jgi:hypothetical protein
VVSRKCYLKMIGAYPGGIEVMASALGMSASALSNRIYERKNQKVTVNTAMLLQDFSGTTYFAESVAQESGGVFIKLPAIADAGNEELLAEFNVLYAELGELSGKFREYVKDNEISPVERIDLDAIAQRIHRAVEELLALSYRIYCR